MVNHMTSRRRAFMHVCFCTVCTRGQRVTGTMDNKTFNSLFSQFPFCQGRAVNKPNNSLFLGAGRFKELQGNLFHFSQTAVEVGFCSIKSFGGSKWKCESVWFRFISVSDFIFWMGGAHKHVYAKLPQRASLFPLILLKTKLSCSADTPRSLPCMSPLCKH